MSVPNSSALYWPLPWKLPRYTSYPILSTYVALSCAQSLPTAAVYYLMAVELEFDPATITLVYTGWFWVGIFRPLYGWISDELPLCAYRRRPYLLLSAAIALCMTIGMGVSPSDTQFIVWGAGLYLSAALCGSMTDALTIEYCNECARAQSLADDSARLLSSHVVADPLIRQMKARIQSECFSVRTVGAILSSALSIVLLRFAMNPRQVVLCSAVFFVPAGISALFIKELPVRIGFYGVTAVTSDGYSAARTDIGDEIDKREAQMTVQQSVEQLENIRAHPITLQTLGSSAQSGVPATSSDEPFDPYHSQLPPLSRRQFLCAKMLQIWNAFKHTWAAALFIFVYYSMPNYLDPWSTYIYTEFSFPAWELDLFGFISLIGTLFGTTFYSIYLTKIPIHILFIFITIISITFELSRLLLYYNISTNIGISAQWFIPFNNLLLSFINGIEVMLPIVLATEYTPRIYGLESSMFSIFQSTDRMGVLLSTVFSVSLIDQFGIKYKSYDNLVPMMTVCWITSLLPLLLIPFMLTKKIPEWNCCKTRDNNVINNDSVNDERLLQ